MRGRNPKAEPLEPGMLAITYHRQGVAMASRDRYWLTPPIERLPDGDPLKRMVLFMAAYAHDIITGQLPGPYTGARAELYARITLMPEQQFRELSHLPDTRLAEHFRAPLEQVAARRHDADIASAR